MALIHSPRRKPNRLARRIRAGRLREISTYEEYSRAIDRTLADDKLFQQISKESSVVHPLNG
jgi:hypothetical protein